MAPFKAGCLTVLAGAVAVIATIYVLHRQSFCISEWRFTSDEVKINAAAFEAFQWNNATNSNPKVNRPIRYASIEEFRTINPDCCQIATIEEVRRWHGEPSFMNVLFGYQTDIVKVRYAERFLKEDETHQSKEKLMMIPVSSCGAVVID
ncbi:MAG: hypothetical protein JNM20_10515 [Rhizobiales bacterium]|nr:hypothetical protein [Hyphomicrobiales bacterium]